MAQSRMELLELTKDIQIYEHLKEMVNLIQRIFLRNTKFRCKAFSNQINLKLRVIDRKLCNFNLVLCPRENQFQIFSVRKILHTKNKGCSYC